MIVTYRDHPISDFSSVVDSDTQFIDVRQPEEVADGVISGTVNIPLGDLAERIPELDRDRRTVVLCRSGGRSEQAAELLDAAGFTDVVNLAGGMQAHDQGGQA